MINKKNKKVNKAKLLRSLKRKADKLWSIYIRKKFGKCIICGSTERLQAHHFVVRKALSNNTRWNILNGVACDYKCHLKELHGNCTLEVLDIYLEAINKYFTKDDLESVRQLSKIKHEYTIEDMYKVIDELEKEICKLEMDKYGKS